MEKALRWRKSSYSGDTGGECVEVAADGAAVAVRDSKRAEVACAGVTVSAWRAFVDAVNDEELR
ncbi:DUF397 domain-containing protein [Streptomyces sp. 8K308]|uniref:DUF397 domain-containing protein n=1 Tax=Streptomyces sp. 8K308 TaxID=2530388 RepID=UPI001045CB34|nr:DUF397 domain-containing protein [Streptomyces sp. 8K308]TDC20851.1 DUF397 domain-containing protein [Streptomyces sp. 8K308]